MIKMKKNYDPPCVEFELFDSEDIITNSIVIIEDTEENDLEWDFEN